MLNVTLVGAVPLDFTDAVLRSEAEGQEGEGIVILRALTDETEVGIVIVCLPSEATEAELEELYVPIGLRKGGIASRVLACAEEYCRQRQVAVLRLWANPLDDDTDQDWLIGWYRRRGYVDAEDGYAELQKIL
jgi:GNAT superfamily N-acetyltransferase